MTGISAKVALPASAYARGLLTLTPGESVPITVGKGGYPDIAGEPDDRSGGNGLVVVEWQED